MGAILILLVIAAVVWISYKYVKKWNQAQGEFVRIAREKLQPLASIVNGNVPGVRLKGTWDGHPFDLYPLGAEGEGTFWCLELGTVPGSANWSLNGQDGAWVASAKSKELKERLDRGLQTAQTSLVPGQYIHDAKNSTLVLRVPVASQMQIPSPEEFSRQLQALSVVKEFEQRVAT